VEKPFGRRRTDRDLSADEHEHLEQIRRDVDQDSTGLIRRYLRLSEKLLNFEVNDADRRQRSATRASKTPTHEAA